MPVPASISVCTRPVSSHVQLPSPVIGPGLCAWIAMTQVYRGTRMRDEQRDRAYDRPAAHAATGERRNCRNRESTK